MEILIKLIQQLVLSCQNVCLQMLTSLDMEAVMSEAEAYCNGASHNRVRGQLPVQDLTTV